MFRVIIIFFISFSVYAQDNILVYAGPGVGHNSLTNTIITIQDLVKDQYQVKSVGPEVINKPDWIKDTALLIIPGGADLPYVEQLNGHGTDNIVQYVVNGGKFIGICAGAYFAADYIEFAKGDSELEVTGKRELKFFPGKVVGPTFDGYNLKHNGDGTKAATIYWQQAEPFAQDTEFTVYYYGGGHFVAPEKYSNVTVLASYDDHAAIVESKVGNGKAILSGLHFEQDPYKLNPQIEQLNQIRKPLVAANQQRIKLVKHLLQRLDIELKS